jgi:hypothetical protein
MRIKEVLRMEKPLKASNNGKMHGLILSVIGIILVIVGTAIINVRGMPFRGSGLGTISVLIGIVLIIIGILRLFYKRPT